MITLFALIINNLISSPVWVLSFCRFPTVGCVWICSSPIEWPSLLLLLLILGYDCITTAVIYVNVDASGCIDRGIRCISMCACPSRTPIPPSVSVPLSVSGSALSLFLALLSQTVEAEGRPHRARVCQRFQREFSLAAVAKCCSWGKVGC